MGSLDWALFKDSQGTPVAMQQSTSWLDGTDMTGSTIDGTYAVNNQLIMIMQLLIRINVILTILVII